MGLENILLQNGVWSRKWNRRGIIRQEYEMLLTGREAIIPKKHASGIDIYNKREISTDLETIYVNIYNIKNLILNKKDYIYIYIYIYIYS